MSNFSFGGNQPQQPQYQHQQQNAQNGAPLQQMPTAMPAFIMPPELQAQLQGVTPEQFAAIAAALQSGLIPLPPAGLAPPPPSAPTSATTADPRLLPQPHLSTNVSATHPTNGDVDMGQEDGEIEDGEVDGASTPQVRGFLRTPPKGPASSRRGSHQQMNIAQNGPRPGMTPRASSSTIPKVIVANGKAPVAPNGNAQLSSRPNREAASKAFVLEMHRAGYTYDDLAREVKDHKMLRRLYVQLGLPVPSSSSVKTPVISQPVASPVNAVRKPLPAPVAKVPEKADRSAYLAKLAAVKGKKTEAAKASATPPAATQAARPTEVQPVLPKTESPLQTQPAAEAAAATTTPPAATPPAVKAPVLSHDKNLLLRQRLEALRAEQAAKQRAKSSSEATQPSSPAPQQVAQSPRTALGAAVEQVSATVASPTVPQHIAAGYVAPPSATASPIANRSAFSLPGLSLPGLFPTHTPPPAQSTSSPRPNASQPFSAPQIPATAFPAQHNGISATHSSFAQGNDANSAERCVIEVSSGEDEHEDDEDEDGEEMDIDDNSEDEQARRVDEPPAVPSKATAPLHSLPMSATPSAPGTPTNAYERKMEEAAALRQKIAEREERARRKVPAPSSALPSSPINGLPGFTAHLGNGNNAFPSVDGALGPQSKVTIEASTQKREVLESRLNGLELLKPSDSPVHPMETSLPPQAVDAHPPTANANTTSDIEDDDDEDLYGEAGNFQDAQYQQAQDTRNGPSFVDSQATTVSEDPVVDNKEPSVEAPSVDHTDDDQHQGMDIDRMLEEQLTEAPAAALSNVPTVKPRLYEVDDDDSPDDDDLDNVYDPPPAIEVVSQAQKSDDTPAVDENDEDSDDAMDTSDESSSDSGSDEDEESGPDNPVEPAASPVQTLVSPAANDLEPAQEQTSKQPQDVDLAAELQPAHDSHEEASRHDIPKPQTYYTPYDSALKRFKDYIYHPDFTNTASTGFKSLTFNHKIDPIKQLCYAELNEGQCTDPQCGWQHFREMNLLDNELLRLIGTVKTPARDPEQKARWNQGLSSLINELRTNPAVGRDAGLIAQRIAEYRRTFVEDPTRVVLFDD